MTFKLKLPGTRSYHSASPNEPEWLMCWIPRGNLAELVGQNRVRHDIRRHFPQGLEVEVSEDAFAKIGLDLGIHPDLLVRTYLDLREAGRLHPSGVVQAKSLEGLARRLQTDELRERLKDLKVDWNRDGSLDKSVAAYLSPMPNYGWICEGVHGNATDTEDLKDLKVHAWSKIEDLDRPPDDRGAWIPATTRLPALDAALKLPRLSAEELSSVRRRLPKPSMDEGVDFGTVIAKLG